jgi:hypothetical protein
LLTTYKGLAKADFGNGETILFWHDLWNGPQMKASFPQLHSFAKTDAITVRSVLHLEQFQDHFNFPLSEVAFQQFCEVSIIIQSLPKDGQRDQWSYIWGNNTYSVSRVYNHLLGLEHVHPAFRSIWKTYCRSKHKVFFWLLLRNRL